MDPRPTAVEAPIHLKIADHLRMRIERGDLAPGDSLPTLAKLCEEWKCSTNSARGAIALLKSQGLISSGRGRAPIVRIPPGKVIRSSDRHQAEKDLAWQPEEERATVGEAETNLGMSITTQRFSSKYDTIEAGPELAELFEISAKDLLLRRHFEATDERTGHLLSSSTSHIPLNLVSANPALLDERNEPWPGGTQHQLSTVGIEIMCMIDQVTGRMPTTAEAQLWGLPDGIPLLICRRISLDADNRNVEISDATYPADRTELRFVTPLKSWTKSP
ncbi:GntR family transcriptional regulator [Streptomyces boncukensis]|uniref:GntR family transcriptional regulator n=1 Tax=Streptomyces boncukensis TaxID=2711219 RepID=A0A6G4X6S5_9ACTN|nr:GntR family transcriptional regulator [Streptomyces boncukensis]NGO72560.1 GntR family transcriptional regulator [Streptomyces boncukensis]